MAHVTKDPISGKITGQFANPQPGMPGYVEIADDDAGLAAWTIASSAPAQYAAMISAGVAVASTGTPALNGTYGCSSQDEINVVSLQTAILAGVPWLGYYRDVTGRKIPMTPAQFTAIAIAIMGFVVAADDAYETALGGTPTNWPPAVAPIP